jgi:PA14 domain/Divergent InlB B-repeat domain
MKKRQALQTAQRNVRLGKAICVAVAVLLVGGVANFAAFGIIRFEYDFTSETGRVFSQDPIPEGITFSGLTLNNVVKLGPSPIPGIGGTLFGPWDPPIDHYISFTIFAPSGYQLHVTSYDASVTIGAIAQLELSGPGTSEEVKMRIFKGAGIRDPRPLSTLRGELSLISTYMLEVGSGSGDGAYATGTMVTVIADPPTGQHFAGWSGDIAILSNPFLATTTAIVPSMNVKIFAMYSELPTYTVTVTNGSGDGNYLAGAQVAISADAAPPGQQFAGWTGEVTFGGASSPTTTFTMPSSAVEVTATYSDSTGTGTGLRGQYYNDSSSASYPPANPFAGSPVLTGTDATVDFSWAGGSPGSPVTSNFFSAKWTGQVKAPMTGSYTFTVTGDDGVRLFLNGVKVIDGWRDQGATPYTYTTTLTAGTLYDIELHYYEHEGDAACRLQWSYPGQTTQAIPQSQLYPTMEETPGTGLRGQYYNDGSSTPYPLANPFGVSPVLTRTDATVDFNWGGNSPGSPVTSNFFSAKWTGQVKAPVTGTYTFTVTGDDGVRLFLNGAKVIDAWRDQGATPYSYTTTLTAGALYDIELHYYEHEGNAACSLQWSYPGKATQAIPQSQLYSNESTQGHELDQENVPIGGSGGLEITRNQTVAQSFSISKPGKLSRVDIIDIRHHRCPPKESLYISLIDMSGDQLGHNTYYTREVYPHEV